MGKQDLFHFVQPVSLATMEATTILARESFFRLQDDIQSRPVPIPKILRPRWTWMGKTPRRSDAVLQRRFYLTELFANVVGAPIATAYGGLMVDFSRVSPVDFLLKIALLMAINQVFLALPLNLYLGSKAKRGLAAWREGRLDERKKARFFSFLTKLPFIQACLVLARMFFCAAGALVLLAAQFEVFWHIAATFTFGFYASFITGLFIYYYLRSATTRFAEEISDGPLADLLAKSTVGARRLGKAMNYLPLIMPTAITSLGIFFLIVAIQIDPAHFSFFAPRMIATLAMNLATISPILIYGQRFQRKRLEAIQFALIDMIDRGDTSRRLPSDLSDGYALTALSINRAFDLFRLVLSQMESASNKLSSAVMSFSSQVRETVASTTQQASAVKEVVSTMEDSNRINEEIRDRASDLTGSARDSQDSVDAGFGKVQETILKMDEIKDANQRTLGEIDGLTEEISSIGEIIEIINGIANQTRIIAFNAELEASSAGSGASAGMSFRIVAAEIRRLANGTVESLISVRDRIAQIQQGSDRLLASSEEGTTKIEEGLRHTADLNSIFKRIRAQAESNFGLASGIGEILVAQGQAFDQIFMTLKQISEGAEQVLASARISGGEVGKLQGLIEELKGLLTRFDYGASRTGPDPRAERREESK